MDAIEHATQGPHITRSNCQRRGGPSNKRVSVRHRQILLSKVYRCALSDGNVREAGAVVAFSVLLYFGCWRSWLLDEVGGVLGRLADSSGGVWRDRYALRSRVLKKGKSHFRVYFIEPENSIVLGFFWVQTTQGAAGVAWRIPGRWRRRLPLSTLVPEN